MATQTRFNGYYSRLFVDIGLINPPHFKPNYNIQSLSLLLYHGMSFTMIIRISVLLGIIFATSLIAAESPANGIAASVIRERAREAEQRGQSLIAQQLRTLADGLSSGTVSLQDATLIVHMALAGSASSPLPTRPTQPAVSAQQVTAILDGETLPPTKPLPAITANIPEKEKVSEQLVIPVVTTVLTASRVGEAKTILVMIGAGEDQQVKIGQRFIIKRGEEKIGVVSATQVKSAMSICIAIAGTVADDGEIRAGDAVLSE